jgi:hypothetical protein
MIPDISPFHAKDRLKINKPKLQFDSAKIVGWKVGFLLHTVQNSFIQQNKHIDCLSNNLA